MEKLVLIDGNSLINRAFYANPPMMNKKGFPTGAIFGFCNMLFKMINEVKPEYLAVAFDLKAPTFRHKMYDAYKGTRKPMPEELVPQVGMLKEVLAAMNIKTFEKAGWEADDIIGTIAKSTDIQTIIVTGDKDSFQLVDEGTSVYFTKRGFSEIEIVNAENFKDKTGITPEQVTDLKALMGDSSDNIPGIPGVGEKTALSLLQTYGDIDALYAHAHELTGKIAVKVTENKDICYLSKKLATIATNVDIDTDVNKMKCVLPFPAAAKKKFIELEFKTIMKKDALFTAEDVAAAEGVPEKEKITTVEQFKNALKSDEFYFAVVGKNLLSVYDGVEHTLIIKENFFDEGLLLDDVLACLNEPFGDENRHITVYDLKKTMHMFGDYGVPFDARFDDVSAIKYLADFSGRDDELRDVLQEYDFDLSTPAYSLSLLDGVLREKLYGEGFSDLYYKVELPLIYVLYSMETDGFKVDGEILDAMGKEYSAELKNLEAKIFMLAGETFNVNSPFQLGTVLFEKLGLKHAKKNKRGYSTSADVLEELVGEHEIIPIILRYRQLQKLYSTYIEGVKPLIDKKTGLIHTSFNQFVTATGRLSSREPNLQNIPIRDEFGKEIRKFFIPRSDEHILLDADYSQIELRLLAHFSKCPALIDAYNRGDDIHTETAAGIFGVKKEEVTPVMRRSAKAVNFGIIYGISDFGLAKNLKISTAKAREYIENYFKKYPEVKTYMDENVAFAKANGYVSTLLGRKRFINEINSSNYNLRSFGERAAMNMPLQGSSADIIKIAMVNVFDRLKEGGFKSKLILQVHDELIIDCLISEKEEVSKLLKTEMENAVKLLVPLTVDVETGKTWYDAK